MRTEPTPAELNFVRQQGWKDASAASCDFQYPALMWQPRVIGGLVLIGLALQSWLWFLALSALLYWSALLPRLSPFDALHHLLVARPRGRPRLPAALGPRRFSQGLAGTFMLGIALALRAEARPLAWVIEGFLLVALAALVFGRLCIGSYLYLLFSGQGSFAHRTLPWSSADHGVEGELVTEGARNAREDA